MALRGVYQPGRTAAALIAVVVIGVSSGIGSAQGFLETFDGIGYTPGHPIPDPPWTAGGAQNQSAIVSSFGWMGTQASYKPGNNAWGESTRSVSVGAGPVEMRAKIHVDAADYGNTTRLGWSIDEGSLRGDRTDQRYLAGIWHEFVGDVDTHDTPGTVSWRVIQPNGTASWGDWEVTPNTWYESRTIAAPLVRGWRVSMDHRQWTGASWGPWQADLVDYDWVIRYRPEFAPTHSRVAHIGTLANTVLDDFSITIGSMIPEPATMMLIAAGGIIMLRRRRAPVSSFL